jgi:uncharacterized protein (DUF927 family)
MNDFNSKTEGEIQPQTVSVTTRNSSITDRDATNDSSANLQSSLFGISEYNHCRDNIPKQRTHTWKSFCEAFGTHAIRSKKDGLAWSPASYDEGKTRFNENVNYLSMAVIDIDDGEPLESILPRIAGFDCLIHSSYSHTPVKNKYRVILPFATPVCPAEWPLVWAKVNALIGGCNDPATKDPARLYYKPVHAPDAEHHFVKIQKGRAIRLDDLPELGMAVQQRPITFHRKGSMQSHVEVDGIESSGPELGFEQGLTEVVNRCAFMQFAAAPENQAGLAEPLWMAMVSNACRFENSEPWIHAASEHHPVYKEAETDRKIQRLQNGPPPITCQRIRDLDFKNCPGGGCKRPNGEVTKAPGGLYGWMFHRQLTAAETGAKHVPEIYQVMEFQVKPEGIFQTIEKNDQQTQIKICSRIDVTALTRDHDSSNWGLELCFNDPDGKSKSWALPKELLANASGERYCASLLKMGAAIEPGKKARDGLAAYLAAACPEARALSVRQPGWFNGIFVLPDVAYGRSDERVVFQTNDPDEIKRFSRKGSLESWQQHIAGPCKRNSRAVISICIGLAPPLLALLGEDNGGFHLRGNSSVGKSICLALGSSIWGNSALIRTWNMTVNGLEGVATMHNDVLLPLDELGQADAKDAGEAAYMLGNGQGKGRANKDGDARTAKRWRNLVLSSGEKSMADLMAAAGQMVMAGQEVRMVEIAADAGCGFGVFEDIHGARSSQVFAESLKQAVAEHHGHAGRAFVEHLANPDLQPKLVERLKTLIQHFVDTQVPAGATGQVGRVGRRFGLVAAAGELCIELGILPWPEGEAIDACKKCFMAWIDLRGGVGNHEAEQAVARVRRFIELHGESRFTLWTDLSDNNGDGKTIQRAGFRRINDDGRTEFFVLPEAYKSEMCAGLNSTAVTKALVDRGFLATDGNGKPQVEKRPPGMGKMRVYHLLSDLMNDGVSQTEKEETGGRQSRVSGSPKNYIV